MVLTVNYDEISRVYDQVRFGDPRVVEYILRHSKLDKPARILEIGCGTGNNTALLAATLQAAGVPAEVWGFDQSEGMLQKAREKDKQSKYLQGGRYAGRNIGGCF